MDEKIKDLFEKAKQANSDLATAIHVETAKGEGNNTLGMFCVTEMPKEATVSEGGEVEKYSHIAGAIAGSSASIAGVLSAAFEKDDRIKEIFRAVMSRYTIQSLEELFGGKKNE